MKVLVTGGSGFVGCRLVSRLLEQGHEVTNIDVAASRVHGERTRQVDIRSYADCESAVRGQDVIVHLAALYRDDVRPRSLYYEVNVEGTRNLVRAAEACSIRHIIFSSSFSVYGLHDAGKSEEGALAPVNDYGRSKMQGEEILTAWQGTAAGRSLQVIRPCVIFGEGGRGNVWTLVGQIASGRFVMIGAGRNRKSMAYVGNVVEFILFLLARGKGQMEIYNYADKPDMPVSEIVDLASRTLAKRVWRMPLPGALAMIAGYCCDFMGSITGRPMVLSSERVRKFMADTSLSVDKARAAGFSPPYDLRQSYVDTIRYEFPGVESTK